MALQSAYFDNFKGGPSVLIWGDAAGLRNLIDVLRMSATGSAPLSQFCQAVDGREIVLERIPESSSMRSTDRGFEWGVSPKDATRFGNLIDALASSGRAGHQYLEPEFCNADALAVIVSMGEYPDDLRP